MGDKRRSAYDYTNKELVTAFLDAAARAGVSSSGLVFDLTRDSSVADACYLKGILLSRLDGKKPPFAAGDRAQFVWESRNPSTVYPVNFVRGHYSRPEAKPDVLYEVARVFYEEDGEWTLFFKFDPKFEGMETYNEYRYPAKSFKKVEQEELALAKASG